MQTLQINRKHMQAVLLFAAKDDIRNYLNGVMVEVMPSSAVRLVAANGYAMAITHTPHDGGEPAPTPVQIIIPHHVCKQFAKINPASKSIALPILLVVRDDGAYTMTCGDLSVNFTPIDGKFIDYRQAFPRECSGEKADFNPELLMLFRKAEALYQPSTWNCRLSMEWNGQGAALCHGVDPEFIGAVMPMRTDSDSAEKGLPEWFDDQAEDA